MNCAEFLRRKYQNVKLDKRIFEPGPFYSFITFYYTASQFSDCPGEAVLKVYRYDELLALSYDQVEQIADGSTSFSVQANPDTGRKIVRFLANETAFRNSRRRLRDRLTYLFRGMVGVSIPAFMPIWNKAVMNGYAISCEERASNVYIVFKAAPDYEIEPLSRLQTAN